MIRGDFLSSEDRSGLIALAKDGSAAHRLARRANALVLLDDGLSCEQVAKVLLLDDDTVRGWHKVYAEHGMAGLAAFNHRGSESHLTSAQEVELFEWVRTSLPRNTRMIGAWIARMYGVEYSRPGLIALLKRLGLGYRKPDLVARQLDAAKQKAFIEAYNQLLRSLGLDEAVVFVDAVHPTHQVRAVGCWAPKDEVIAITPSSGRDRLNIHGAIDLETGQTRMIEAETIDAASTIRLLAALETLYPRLALIHVFLDNARYHHARLVKEWLARPSCRIRLHFIPAYCPHLNPIERLWGVMHKHVTHNKSHATCRHFADAIFAFLREKVPKQWDQFRDSVTDNFRIINPSDFRVMA